MSGVLTKFLDEEAERLQAQQPARQAKLADWQAAVRGLMAQLAEWVRAADPKKLIEIDESQSQRLVETGLGLYYVPRLSLRLEAHQIWVIPKARNVAAFVPSPTGEGERQAEGLVIITDYPPIPLSDYMPAPVYNLYRLVEPGGDQWFIRPATASTVELLDRERFETVLVNMLQ